MPPETRGSLRSERAPDVTDRRERRRSIARRIWLVVAIIVILLLAATAWLAFKAITVKDELEAARAQVAVVQEGGDVEPALVAMGDHARKATEAAGDPVWKAFEMLPIAGDNLRAVRLAAESLNVLSNDLALPILQDDGSGTGITARALPVMTSTAPRIQELARQVEEVAASSFLIGPVRGGIDQVAEVIVPAAPVLGVVPALLGAEEPKDYLLVFQNNAETLPLGGSAASQTLMQVDNGSLQITAQAGSGEFDNGNAVDVEVDQSAIDLYTDFLVSHVNTTVSRPDFPTAARLLTAFWNRDIDQTEIDGVISVSPLALQRILKATGPIDVNGIELNDGNAVSVLLSDAYRLFDPKTSDGFFALTATQVFDRVGSGDFNPKDMIWAITESIDHGDILVYSEDESIEPLISGQRVSGVLPTTNEDATTVGVFFRDTSASKIDYYMKSSASVVGTCDAGTSTFAVSAGLHLDLSQETADDLPDYVQSGHWDSEKFRTEVFVYGPPGTTFASASMEGNELETRSTDIVDLGRPVAKFEIYLRPGEKAKVDATFTGTGQFGPLELRNTPMIHTTETSLSGEPCA